MRTNCIPKIIYQTWETKDLDPSMRAAMQSWIDLNPDYEHRLFDAQDRYDYIKTHFPERTLKAYERLRPGTYQADFWRYCVLYKTGGVNVDIDCVCLAPLDQTIQSGDTFVSGLAPSYEFAIWVGFVAAQQGHQFLQVSLDHVIRNIETDFYGQSGVWPTGPVAAGIAVNRYAGLPDKTHYKLGINQRNGMELRLLDFNRETKSVYNDAGVLLMNTKYEGYTAYYKVNAIPYAKAWREGKIYHYEGRSLLRASKQLWRMVSTRQGRKHCGNLWRRFLSKWLLRVRRIRNQILSVLINR